MAQEIPIRSAKLGKSLEYYYKKYNRTAFIASDPISVPHRFSLKSDIEISGFLSATLSWGQRPVILRNSRKLLSLMDDDPTRYVLGASAAELDRLNGFVHRTFNGADARYFILSLRRIYRKSGGLETVFSEGLKHHQDEMGPAISHFRKLFFSGHDPGRTGKHVADPLAGSSSKRINMFLRRMVRVDASGIDFGLWKTIKPSRLMCPLDVHSGRVARELGLLTRIQNDWKAVTELTENLRIYDPADPVKYDFALFGIGVNE